MMETLYIAQTLSTRTKGKQGMGIQQVDLNCDLGEGFGQWTMGEASDESLMALISSANVAAGFHAGDANHMDRVVRRTRAHPE